jgi:hypothetical protein
MAKKRLTDIAKETEMSFEDALKIAADKLPEGALTGKGKNTWVDGSFAEVLLETQMIDEIIPKYYKGQVIRQCLNPKYVYVLSKNIGTKVPVLIPKRYQGKLKPRKNINFEAIQDSAGISYRYDPRLRAV